VLPRLFTALLPWLSEPHHQAPHLVRCQCMQPSEVSPGTQCYDHPPGCAQWPLLASRSFNFQIFVSFSFTCVRVCVFAHLTAVAQLPLLDVVADILRLAQNWLRSSTLHLEPLLVPLMQHANAQTRQVRACVRVCARDMGVVCVLF
jgi:hypothetical protein